MFLIIAVAAVPAAIILSVLSLVGSVLAELADNEPLVGRVR
jgi:hypothetical protein